MQTEPMRDDKSRPQRTTDAAGLIVAALLVLLILVALTDGRWYALAGFALGMMCMFGVWVWEQGDDE